MSTNIGTLTAILEADASRLNGTLTAAQMSFARFEAGALKTGKGVTSAFNGISAAAVKMGGVLAGIGIAGGLIGMAKMTTQVGMDLEHMLTVAGAVMRATEAEMRTLEKTAKQMGATTEYSSAQAAQALKYLGQAGFSATEAVKALPGVLDLATAGNIGLAESADIAAAVLRSMQMPVEQLSRVNDVFVATINRSSTEIADLAEAFKYVAPVAAAYGYSIEEVAAMLGKLGDAGIKGSMAGTNLAMSMQRAYAYAKEMRLESGKFIDVLAHLMKTGQDAKDVIPGVFDIRSSRAALILAEIVDELGAFTEELKGTKGEADRLAATMRGTLPMQFKELQSAVESVAEDAFALYRDKLWDAVWATIDWIRSHKKEILAFADAVISAISAVGWSFGSLMEILGGGLRGATAFSSIRTDADKAKIAIDGLTGTAKDVENLGNAAGKAAEGFEALRKAAEKKPDLSGWYSVRDLLDAVIKAAKFGVESMVLAISMWVSSLVELFDWLVDNIRAVGSVAAAVTKMVLEGLNHFDHAKIAEGGRDLEEALGQFRGPQWGRIVDQGRKEFKSAWADFVDDIGSIGLKGEFGIDVNLRSLREAEKKIQEWKDKILSESGRAPMVWTPPVKIDWSKISTEELKKNIEQVYSFKAPEITVPVSLEMSLLGPTTSPTAEDLSEEITAQLAANHRKRLDGIRHLEEINYQARLAEADEFDRARFGSSATFSRQMLEAERQYKEQLLEIERWYQEQVDLFPAQAFETYQELQQARFDLETVYAEQRAEIARAEQEQLVADWLATHDILIQASDQFVNYWIEAAWRGGGTWREVLNQVGQAVVVALAQKAVSALWNFIAASATATAAEVTLATATGTATVATGALAAASATATALQVAETAAVTALTAAYYALAEAKAAAGVAGTAAGAAGTVVFGVVNILEGLGGLFGFDDPANDAVAFRHGSDYMREFMAGARQKAAAPAFGVEISGMLSQAAAIPQPSIGDRGDIPADAITSPQFKRYLDPLTDALENEFERAASIMSGARNRTDEMVIKQPPRAVYPEAPDYLDHITNDSMAYRQGQEYMSSFITGAESRVRSIEKLTDDAAAFQDGQQYMTDFVAGLNSVESTELLLSMKPATVGSTVSSTMFKATEPAPKQAEEQQQVVTVHNHFEGVVSEDFQRETVQLTGRASKRRQVKLYSVTDPRFGGSLALGGI